MRDEMNLWQIDEEILNTCIDEETGEIIDEERLSELQMTRDRKIENIAKWIKNLEADEKALDEQKKAFDARLKSATAKKNQLRSYLERYLGGEQFMAMDLSVAISYRKSQQVEINDETLIPEDYIWVKTERNPDKASIKQAIKAGHDVPGASLVDKMNMQIR
jgi:hypothetical protein